MPDGPVPLCHFVTFPPHRGGIVHRTRFGDDAWSLTVTSVLQKAMGQNPTIRIKKNTPTTRIDVLFLVGVTGLEPMASWSRTKRDTKLRHTPLFKCSSIIYQFFCKIKREFEKMRFFFTPFLKNGNSAGLVCVTGGQISLFKLRL